MGKDKGKNNVGGNPNLAPQEVSDTASKIYLRYLI